MQRIGIGQQQRMHSRMVTHQRERRVLFQPPLHLFPHRPSRSWRSPNCRTRVPTCPLAARPSLDLSTITQSSISSCLAALRNPGPRTHAVNPCLTAACCMSGPPSACLSICHAGFSARSLAHGGGGPTKINVSDKATTVPSLLASPVIDRTHKSLSPSFPFQPGCTTTTARAAPATIAAEAAANN